MLFWSSCVWKFASDLTWNRVFWIFIAQFMLTSYEIYLFFNLMASISFFLHCYCVIWQRLSFFNENQEFFVCWTQKGIHLMLENIWTNVLNGRLRLRLHVMEAWRIFIIAQMTFTNYAIASNWVERASAIDRLFFSLLLLVVLASTCRASKKKMVRKIFVSARFEINYSNRLIFCKLLYRVFYCEWLCCSKRNCITELFEADRQASEQSKTIPVICGKVCEMKNEPKNMRKKCFCTKIQ